MIVGITSLVPKYARKKPAIPATIAPASAPIMIANGNKMYLGILGLANTNQTEVNQPA